MDYDPDALLGDQRKFRGVSRFAHRSAYYDERMNVVSTIIFETRTDNLSATEQCGKRREGIINLLVVPILVSS